MKFLISKAAKKIIEIDNNVEKAIAVMRDAGRWLLENGKNPSKWWQLKNLNRKFLFQYAQPEEFYVILINGKPAAAAILQLNQNAQDWKNIDKNRPKSAVYIHWLCVHCQFRAAGLPRVMIDFAAKLAAENHTFLLRVDTNADEMKLRKIYEDLGFELVAIEQENYRRTAFYQKSTI